MNIVLNTLFTINMFASVMILAILAVSLILKGKVHNKIICFLWLLVLARLVIPITLESPVHLDTLLPQTQSVEKPPVIEANIPEPVSMDSIPITTIDDSEVSYTPPIKPHIDTLDNNNEPVPYVQPSPPSRFEQVLSAIKRVDIWTYVLIAWAIGVVTLFARAMVEYLRFKRRVKLGRQIKDLIVNNIATECKAALCLDKEVRIITSRYVRTPVTFGFVHPIVLLPVGISHKLGEHKLRMVIIHELCHIKRKDIFINYLWLIAKMISWFNPLIYVAYKQHLHAIEIACDEMVLKNISMDDSFDYSESLLDVLRISRSQKVVPVALSFCQDKTKIRKRVENMITPQHKLKSAGFISILLAVVMVIGCFTTACQPTKTGNIKPSPINNITEDDTPDKVDNSSTDKVKTSTPVPTPEPTPVPIEPIYKATDHVNKVLSPKSEALSVTIDADVEVPATTAFPILKLEPKILTQERVDSFLDTFFPTRENYAKCELSKPQSKADIQKAIDRLENWIKTKEDKVDQTGQSSHDAWQQMIDYYKTELEKAPETLPNKIDYDITKFSTEPLFNDYPLAEQTEEEISKNELEAREREKRNNTGLINYEFILEDQSSYNIYALRSKAPYVNAFYINDMRKGYFGYNSSTEVENYSDIPELKTTFKQAQEIAEKALNILGIDYMSLDLGLKCPINIVNYKEKKELNIGSAYHLVYTRVIQGANVTYTKNIANNPEHDYQSWSYDYFHIWIDDEGIYRVSWQCCPSEISETISSNETLLPFEDIMNVANNVFEEDNNQIKHCWYIPDLNDNDNKLLENNIIIDKIKLGYMKICKDFDAQEYFLMPVWDFIGRENAILDSKNKWDNKDMPQNTDFHSLLTINAIDGSIIDRRKSK